MKTFALVALLVSFSSMAACPNLAGTYATCTSSTGEVTTGDSITQTTVNGVTTYTLTYVEAETGAAVEEKIIADGAARSLSQTDEQTGMVMTMTTKASCSGTALINDVKVSLGAETFAHFLMTITKSGNKLMMKTMGTTGGETINETTVCE